MFEGDYIRWSIDPANGDVPIACIELLKADHTKESMLKLIEELMAVRDRLRVL